MHPEFVLGGIRIDTHLFFSTLGLAVGLALYYHALRRRGLLGPTVVWVSIAVLVGGVLGARLVLAWDHLDDLRSLDGLSLVTAIERSGKIGVGVVFGSVARCRIRAINVDFCQRSPPEEARVIVYVTLSRPYLGAFNTAKRYNRSGSSVIGGQCGSIVVPHDAVGYVR